VWDALVSHSLELYAAELLDDMELAFEDGLVNPGYIRFDDVKRKLSMGKELILAKLVNNPHRQLVDDTVAEMGWWACFHEDRSRKAPHVVADAKLNLDILFPPIRRAAPKIGRNEACPCGSGKKYKKCCGA
jgi:hypothetical protein